MLRGQGILWLFMLGAMPLDIHSFAVMFPGLGSLYQECYTGYSEDTCKLKQTMNLDDMIVYVCVCVCVS